MKKVLITGGRGFLGSNLVPVLENKYDIEIFDLEDEQDVFDLTLELAIAGSDIVIHLAALTSVADSFNNPEETFRVNVLGTARVCELCVKYNKKLIISYDV